MDIDVLAEVYRVMKEYIPTKDRQASADHVCSVVADSGVSETELREFCGEDKYLGRAIIDYLGEDESLESDEDE